MVMFFATIINNSYDYYHDGSCDNDIVKILFWLRPNYLIVVNYFLAHQFLQMFIHIEFLYLTFTIVHN